MQKPSGPHVVKGDLGPPDMVHVLGDSAHTIDDPSWHILKPSVRHQKKSLPQQMES